MEKRDVPWCRRVFCNGYNSLLLYKAAYVAAAAAVAAKALLLRSLIIITRDVERTL
jgi:hypothetical protein